MSVQHPAADRTLRIVVMGVSGSGKTTIGVRLADVLGIEYLEADDAHPPANVEKMAAGIPLTDDDRRPWLHQLAAELARRQRVVITCSALKREYRDLLREAGGVTFVYLRLPPDVATDRVANREGHFMGPAMVADQYDTLEPPTDNETDVVTIDATATPAGMVASITAAVAAADRSTRAATVRFDVVDPSDPEAIVAMTTYFDELDARFVDGFDPGDTLTADAASMREPHGAFVVARADDRTVACGGIVRHDTNTGEIKRMWVDADWRGVGLGRRMLATLEAHVARLGYSRVVLDTNAVLTEAVAMYERSGYVPIPRYNDNPYAHRWFAKSVATDGAGGVVPTTSRR